MVTFDVRPVPGGAVVTLTVDGENGGAVSGEMAKDELLEAAVSLITAYNAS